MSDLSASVCLCVCEFVCVRMCVGVCVCMCECLCVFVCVSLSHQEWRVTPHTLSFISQVPGYHSN
jgi:hypothetical protein